MIYEDTDSKKTCQITKDVLLMSIYGRMESFKYFRKIFKTKIELQKYWFDKILNIEY